MKINDRLMEELDLGCNYFGKSVKILSYDSDDLRWWMVVKFVRLYFFYVEDCGWYEVVVMMVC